MNTAISPRPLSPGPATEEEASPFDALPPPGMARRAEEVGEAKAATGTANLFVLAVLAGAFIAMGAVFSSTVMAGGGDLAFGVARLLGGVAFSLGLILVVVAGAALFTGDTSSSWPGPTAV